MTDFENKLRLKTVSSQLMSIVVAKNVLLEQVFELADREVDGTPSCEPGYLLFVSIIDPWLKPIIPYFAAIPY
jgi:hypothetical protein